MNAIKAMYRSALSDVMYSVIPTHFRSTYGEGVRTEAEIGRLFVHVDENAALGFARSVVGWYHPEDQGTIEVWRVQCGNLFLVERLLQASRCLGRRDIAYFWERLPFPQEWKSWGLGKAISTRLRWYSTEWVRPTELLREYRVDGEGWMGPRG